MMTQDTRSVTWSVYTITVPFDHPPVSVHLWRPSLYNVLPLRSLNTLVDLPHGLRPNFVVLSKNSLLQYFNLGFLLTFDSLYIPPSTLLLPSPFLHGVPPPCSNTFSSLRFENTNTRYPTASLSKLRFSRDLETFEPFSLSWLRYLYSRPVAQSRSESPEPFLFDYHCYSEPSIPLSTPLSNDFWSTSYFRNPVS